MKSLNMFMLAAIFAATSLLGESSVRVYSVRDACFPYRFDSISMIGSKGAQLSFSHISGSRTFATVGNELPGAFRVESVEKRTLRVFEPTINAERDEPAHRVTLRSPANDKIVLEVGKPLKIPGLMACLVNMESGRIRYVTSGQIIMHDEALWRIAEVTNTMVVATLKDAQIEIPLMTDPERESIEFMWAERRRVAKEDKRLAEAQRREEELAEEQKRRERIAKYQAALDASSKPRGSSSTTMNFGSVYRYPVEWEVVPIWGRKDGQTFLQPIAVPRRFETRQSGISIQHNN